MINKTFVIRFENVQLVCLLILPLLQSRIGMWRRRDGQFYFGMILAAFYLILLKFFNLLLFLNLVFESPGASSTSDGRSYR